MKILQTLTSLLAFSTLAYADVYADFNKHIEQELYLKACIDGKNIYLQGEKNEETLSRIGEVCLRADYIYVLAMVQSRLRTTKDSRNNAVAFSSIVLQKRLVYQFMYDDADISTLALPVIDHPISHAFVAIRDKEYRVVSSSPKVITFDQDGKNYKAYIDFKDKGRIVIDEQGSNAKIITHRYL